MSTLEEIRLVRLKKRQKFFDDGSCPYPNKTNRDTTIQEAVERFTELLESGEKKVLVGRVMSVRGQGAISFVNISDGTGDFQAVLHKGEIDDEKLKMFKDLVDLGDFIEIDGEFFLTKRGSPSLKIRDWKMLSKSIRPLPEKWHGLKSNEERYRRRYLDILMNPDLKDVFQKKSEFWRSIRTFLEKRDFFEVQTPSLELTTGGAEARPFKTHHNDLDLDLYLRISVGELWQKRLMSAGFSKTYEIGRVYRNEGSSPEHLQEFTNMEFYASYMNFDDGKEMVKDLYRTVAQEVFGKTAFETRGHKFDLADEWPDLNYVNTIKEMTGVNVLESSESDLQKKLSELEIEYEGSGRERMIDSLWKYCRKQISGPAFLVDHPKEVAPLSKTHEDDPRLTRTFQIILAGSEIGRGHAELNDPVDQADRFAEQQKLIEAGDDEAMMPDWDFVEMLEHGMPPTFGFGVGERLFSFLVDKPIREVTLFPLMRPKDDK